MKYPSLLLFFFAIAIASCKKDSAVITHIDYYITNNMSDTVRFLFKNKTAYSSNAQLSIDSTYFITKIRPTERKFFAAADRSPLNGAFLMKTATVQIYGSDILYGVTNRGDTIRPNDATNRSFTNPYYWSKEINEEQKTAIYTLTLH
jgi:hypothetical protein